MRTRFYISNKLYFGVQEQLNDEKTLKKPRVLLKKNNARDDTKTTKIRSFVTRKKLLKGRKLMKRKKTTTIRQKRQYLTKRLSFLRRCPQHGLFKD